MCSIPAHVGAQPALPEDDEVVHLFTDGGCICPNQPQFRVASWAFCTAHLSGDRFIPGDCGLLEGPFHTSLRAEIRAAIGACDFALAHRCPFVIWTDNQLVFDRLQQFRDRSRGPPTVKHTDHDLWNRLYYLVQAVRPFFFEVVKVVSHMDIDEVSGTIDRWVVAGNEAADKLATDVLARLPEPMLLAHKKAREQWQFRWDASTHLQTFLLAMGQRAIAAKEQIQHWDADKWEGAAGPDAAPGPDVSFAPFPTNFDDVMPHTLGPCFAPLANWIEQLSSGGDTQGMWLCNYQLLVHFQRYTGMIGFWYNRPKKEWLLADDLAREQGFDFCRFAAWLLAAMKAFAKACRLPLTIQPSMPWGTCFRSWQRCIYVQASVAEFTEVDSQLAARGAVALKTVQVLRDTAAFCTDR